MLDTSRVLLFVKAVDVWDREQVGLLLERNEGFTAEWDVVKRVRNRFEKWREWSNEGSSTAGPVVARKLEEPLPVRKEETQSLLETGLATSGMVKGLSGGVDTYGARSSDCLGLEG